MMSVGLSKVRVATTLSALRTQVSEILVTVPGPVAALVATPVDGAGWLAVGAGDDEGAVEAVGRAVVEVAVEWLVDAAAVPGDVEVTLPKVVVDVSPGPLAANARAAQVTRAAMTVTMPMAPNDDMARMPPSPPPGGRWRPPLGTPDTSPG